MTAPIELEPDPDVEDALPAPSWRFEARGLATVLLPGLYAWGATVAFPAFASRVASPVARFAALGALVALLIGPILGRRRLRLGRAIGVLGFIGMAAAGWGALGAQLRNQLDPVRAALGALAWGLFALGWGSFPVRTRLPEDDPQAVGAGRSQPRARLPRVVSVAFGGLLAAALALPLLAWRVEKDGVALLAHAASLAGAVALTSVGARVWLAPAGPSPEPRPRFWLIASIAWLCLGLAARLF